MKAHLEQFLKALNSNRRSIVHQLRHETGPKIFRLLAETDKVKPIDRETHVAFISALKTPGNNEYAKYPPILFPPGYDQDLTKLFRVEQLPLVINFTTNVSEDLQTISDSAKHLVCARIVERKESTIAIDTGNDVGCARCYTRLNRFCCRFSASFILWKPKAHTETSFCRLYFFTLQMNSSRHLICDLGSIIKRFSTSISKFSSPM